MLAGLISEPSCGLPYPAVLRRVLQVVADPTLLMAPLGRHTLEGDQLFFVLSDYQTKQADSLFPETHREYCDVQVVIRGREVIGWAPKTDDFIGNGEYSTGRDIQFYEKTSQLSWLSAKPGRFFLFAPGDVHLPGVAADGSESVRKAVVKIHRNLLAQD
jgi:biofilm protein TabA